MAPGERRRRSVIAKLVELAIALLVVLTPASALALTRASVVENASALAALHAKTRVRGFELAPAEIASGFELSSARNASGKSARGRGEGVRVHHRNRVWSPELGAFLSPDEFIYHRGTGTLWSWPGQNPIRWRDPTGRVGWATGLDFGIGNSLAMAFGLPAGVGVSGGVFYDISSSGLTVGLYGTTKQFFGVGTFIGAGGETVEFWDLASFKGTSTGITANAKGGYGLGGTIAPGQVDLSAGFGGGAFVGLEDSNTSTLQCTFP